MNCKHCQQPMIHVFCEDCDGRGYWYERDEWGMTPTRECAQCGGEGKRWHCTNTNCPGIVWYPLSRADSQMLRMVQANAMAEEKRGK